MLWAFLPATLAWSREGRSPPDTLLRFTVALHVDATAIDEAFWRVSDPASPDYAQHLTAMEVAEMSRPKHSSMLAVSEWIRSVAPEAETSTPTLAGDFVSCTLTVAQAEQLLPGAVYHRWRHPTRGTIVHRTSEITIPTEMQPHVAFAAPTTSFPSPLVPAKGDTLHAMAAAYAFTGDASPVEAEQRADKLRTDPPSIRSLYQLGDAQATGLATQQVAGFLNNSISLDDLSTFFGTYYPAAKGRVPTISGPNDPDNPGIEGSLDIQYIMSIGANVSTTYVLTPGERPYPVPGGGTGENEPFLDWLLQLGATDDAALPGVASVSYADMEYVVDAAYAARCDVEFQKLALRGVSLLFGSGDNGVTGDKGACPLGKFVPWWPASSPYVTAVGATNAFMPTGATFSGGGFSDRHAAPPFQQPHIAQYMKKVAKLPPAKWFNHTGRGFPDVSAVGLSFWVYNGGLPTEVGGTSAATPVFAGVVSLLNDARQARGKAPLGYLNPLLYAHPEAFTDITVGQNPGGGGCGIGGFSCAVGWDPVTGLGTPLYPKLLELALSLPPGRPIGASPQQAPPQQAPPQPPQPTPEPLPAAAASEEGIPTIHLESVAFADAHRAAIAARVNGDAASTWRATASPPKFAGTPYRVLLTYGAGVLGGDPRENAARLPIKTLADLRARSPSLLTTPLPAAFDSRAAWPQCPIIGEIRDQSACGSCYAVSAASAASDRFCIAHNGTKMPRLSAVDLMSCCFTCKGANGGCFGGTPSHCWDYIASQGIATGGAYGDHSRCLEYPFPECAHHTNGSHPACPDKPYNAPTCFWKCDADSTDKSTYDAEQAEHVFGSSYKVDADEEAIMAEIAAHGPVQASMFLVAEFEVYESGVFTTSSKAYIGAHAVKIVGWGVDGGTKYWRVANSWNDEWGEDGYFRIERGIDCLAIESGVVAGTVAKW